MLRRTIYYLFSSSSSFVVSRRLPAAARRAKLFPSDVDGRNLKVLKNLDIPPPPFVLHFLRLLEDLEKEKEKKTRASIPPTPTSSSAAATNTKTSQQDLQLPKERKEKRRGRDEKERGRESSRDHGEGEEKEKKDEEGEKEMMMGGGGSSRRSLCLLLRRVDVAAKEIVLRRGEILPNILASILVICSKRRYLNDRLINSLIDSLTTHTDVNSMVTALLAVQSLERPTHRLLFTFLQQLRGNCSSFSFWDLLRIFVSLSRLQSSLPRGIESLVEEVCEAMVAAVAVAEEEKEDEDGGEVVEQRRRHSGREKGGGGRRGIDSREFLIIPICLVRLNFHHEMLIRMTFARIRSLFISRIRCEPLDSLQALEGLIRLGLGGLGGGNFSADFRDSDAPPIVGFRNISISWLLDDRNY